MEKDTLIYAVIGCAMKVHTTLGNSFQEAIYQRCLAIELERAALNFSKKVAHLVQAKNYTTAYNFDKGLLINFRAESLQYKLVFNSKTNYK